MNIFDKRYESDYDEVEELDENGNKIKVLHYRGTRFQCLLKPEELRRKKAQLFIMTAAAAVLYVFAGSRHALVNKRGPAGMVGGFVLVAMTFLIWGLVRYTYYKEPFRRDQYERTIQYSRYGAMCGMFISAATAVISLILTVSARAFGSGNIAATAGYAAVAVLLYAVFRTVRSIPYEELWK